MATPLNEATVSGLAAGPTGNGNKAVVVAKPEELRNHRLIVMFFDLTSMQPEDLERAVDAAQTFLRTKMQAADVIALVSLGDTLSVDQDFTADKNALINEVGAYNGTEGQGFAQGANANSNQVEDTTAYTPDESEYNDLNTDRELFALRAVSKSLERINEKKSMLYFSGGISRDGIENEASLRSAINSAVRADLAIYSVDTRGLQAIGPLGDASTGSLRGQGGFNGGALMNNMKRTSPRRKSWPRSPPTPAARHSLTPTTLRPPSPKSRPTLRPSTPSASTPPTSRATASTASSPSKSTAPASSSNTAPATTRPPTSSTPARKTASRKLQDQLASDLPATDMAVYMDAMYFRLDANRFYMPVSLVVPGSQIPFVKGGDKDKATLDIIGAVIDESKRPVGRVRDTVKLNLDPSLQARQKNIQYTTSFDLPPGKYQIKFVVRENQTGRMGSFIADVTLPDLKKVPLKMSSILLASQRSPSKKAGSARPQRPGVRAQHQPRLPPGPAHVPALRGLRARAREGRRKRAQRNQARHQPAQQPRTDSGLNQGLRDADCAGQIHQRRRPRRRVVRTRCPAGQAQTGPVRLPVERNRRCRRQLRISTLRRARARTTRGSCRRSGTYTNCHAACHTRRESILLRWSVAIASLPHRFRGLIAQRVGSHAGLPTRWLAHRLTSLMIATRIIAPANAIRVL